MSTNLPKKENTNQTTEFFDVYDTAQSTSIVNPTEFDAYQWAKTAKNAGMKYITITSRHHDGFSMFNSKASDYNIVIKTPYKKDILKDLSTSLFMYLYLVLTKKSFF